MTTKLNVYLPDGAPGGDPGGTAAPLGYARREMAHLKNPGSTGNNVVGMQAPAVSATGTAPAITNADDADGPFYNLATAATVGSTAGVTGSATTGGTVRRDWAPELAWVLKTPASLADLGLWCGFANASADNNPDPAGVSLAAFRYYTSTDGTAFWRAVTKDGSGTTVTATTAAIAAATRYVLRIALGAAGATFYVNDTEVASHAATLPAGSTVLFPILRATALAAAATSIRHSRYWVSSL